MNELYEVIRPRPRPVAQPQLQEDKAQIKDELERLSIDIIRAQHALAEKHSHSHASRQDVSPQVSPTSLPVPSPLPSPGSQTSDCDIQAALPPLVANAQPCLSKSRDSSPSSGPIPPRRGSAPLEATLCSYSDSGQHIPSRRPRPNLGSRVSSALRSTKNFIISSNPNGRLYSRRGKSSSKAVEEQGLLAHRESLGRRQSSATSDGTETGTGTGTGTGIGIGLGMFSRKSSMSMCSEKTLVEGVAEVEGEAENELDSAAQLLEVLTPLITAIQKLSPRIACLAGHNPSYPTIAQEASGGTEIQIGERTTARPRSRSRDDLDSNDFNDPEDLVRRFIDECQNVREILSGLKVAGRGTAALPRDQDVADMKMRDLMLNTLMKKVENEVMAVEVNHQEASNKEGSTGICSTRGKSPSQASSPSTSNSNSTTPAVSRSPSKIFKSNNPFILHSTSLQPSNDTSLLPLHLQLTVPVTTTRRDSFPLPPDKDDDEGVSGVPRPNILPLQSKSNSSKGKVTPIPIIGGPPATRRNRSPSSTTQVSISHVLSDQQYIPDTVQHQDLFQHQHDQQRCQQGPGQQQQPQQPHQQQSFSAFVGGAQSSLWATNVRLASFQNSLLFSPSPIAVRRVVGSPTR